VRTLADTEDAADRKALQDIERVGCHVLGVGDDGDEGNGLPPFAYSIGIHGKTGAPELIVVGLALDTGMAVVNLYNQRVRAGERFVAGQQAEGFLQGLAVEFRAVHPSQYPEYLGWARWLYRGDDFPALQLVFPSSTGHWPWDDAAPELYLACQPLLDVPFVPSPNA
jgi:hypothetical protein